MTTRAKILVFTVLCAASIALTAVAVADAPAGRYTVRSQTVLDNRTHLVWQRGFGTGAETQALARAYCEGLVLGGSDEWELPTVEELISILDPTLNHPALDPAFTGSTVEHFEFWTTSPVLGDPNSATNCWAVNFAAGHTYRPLVSGMQDVTPDNTRCVLRPELP